MAKPKRKVDFKVVRQGVKRYKKDEHKSLKGINVFNTVKITKSDGSVVEKVITITDKDIYMMIKDKVEYQADKGKL